MKISKFLPAAEKLHVKTFDMLKSLNFFKKYDKFDITVAMAVGGNEPTYYVAKKLNSTLALYFTQQVSILNQDWAMGQPHNPAIQPLLGETFA